MEWSTAGQHCRSLHKDAHLLVISDAEEQAAVAGMISSITGEYRFMFLFIHVCQ